MGAKIFSKIESLSKKNKANFFISTKMKKSIHHFLEKMLMLFLLLAGGT